MKLLDLYCGGGGCSVGYHRAGFEVVGVDLLPQPSYPYTFHQDDALAILSDSAFLAQFDVIHASPECKGYTHCNLSPKEKYQKQIALVREGLAATGKPYIIENVEGAKPYLRSPLMLCGTMFGLRTTRHRFFETSIPLYFAPAQCDHRDAPISVYGHSVWDSSKVGTQRKDGRARPDSVPVQVGHDAMGITWMSKERLAQAIPPAYTEWIGRQFLEMVTR